MKRYAVILTIILAFIFGFGSDESFAAAPAHDNFGSALPVVVTDGTAAVTSDNIDATKEPDEPDHARNAGGKSVWFKFTPTATSVFLIKATDNDFDTLLAVYTGSSTSALQPVGYNDDCHGSCSGSSIVNLMLTAGTTYYIAVDGFNDGGTVASGNFKLTLLEYNPPINDNLNGKMNLGFSHSGSIAGTNYNATREGGEPDHASSLYPGVKSVWYQWTPTGDSYSTEFELTTDNFNSQMAVYSAPTGSPTFAQLTRVAWNSNFYGDANNRYRIKFFAELGKTYFIAVAGHNYYPGYADGGNFQLSFRPSRMSYSMDTFSYDRSASIGVFRPSEGNWYVLSGLGFSSYTVGKWGTTGDTPLAADFNGDGDSEFAVARSENGLKVWYILNHPLTSTVIQWGLATDKTAIGDFDGDGRADLTAIRLTAQGYVWYVRQSSNGVLRAFVFGTTGDKPVFGDFDGDRSTDVAVVRNTPNGLVWYILKSDGNYQNYSAVQFGVTPDAAAPADYDGDGKTDIAVFRPSNGTWYIVRSATGEVQITAFGTSGDKPQPADYDGDGKADLGLFRPATGDWYFWLSESDTQQTRHFGMNGDIPLASLATLSQ